MTFPSGTKITITGDLGSGKSAVSKILCDLTGFNYVSTGRIQRQLAQEMGIDTLEMNRRADTDPNIDQKIDGIFAELDHDAGSYVVDSRMAWFFLPGSFKVYLKADINVAVDRIMRDPNRNSEQYRNREEAIQKITARKQSENERFLVKYGADGSNLQNFDLVVDTTQLAPAEVAGRILKMLELKLSGIAFSNQV